MKIIQINAVCHTGSTGRICKELNEALLQQGHQGMILYGNGSSQYSHSKKIAGNPGVKLHGLLSGLFGKVKKGKNCPSMLYIIQKSCHRKH